MILCYKIDRIPVNYDKCLLLYHTLPPYFRLRIRIIMLPGKVPFPIALFILKNRNVIILFLYLRKLYLENMEEYIGTVIKAGGIVIGCVMVLFVIWYIVKDILDISEKDSSDGK